MDERIDTNKDMISNNNDDTLQLGETEKNLPNSNTNNNQKSFLDFDHIANEIYSHLDMNSSLNEIINNKNTNNTGNKIIFVMKDKMNFEVDLLLAIKGYPNLLNAMNLQRRSLILPEWIEIKHLKDYYSYVEYYFESTNDTNINTPNHFSNFNFKKLTQITNFFENEKILQHIFNNKINPNINIENSISLLLDSYRYCSSESLFNERIKNLWFNMFLRVLDFISMNFIYFLNGEDSKIKKLNPKLLEEIIEKFLFFRYSQNSVGTNNNTGTILNESQTKNLIKILHDLRCSDSNSSIVSLFSQEHLHLTSDSSISDLIHLQNPTFQINLSRDFKYHHQEYKINFHSQQAVLIISYKNSEDTLSVTMKMNNTNKYCLSLMSLCYTENNSSTNSNNNTSREHQKFNINSFLSDSTESSVIFKIHNYKNFSKNRKNLNLVVNLKFCSIHQFILNYIEANFNSTYNDKELSKLSKNSIKTLLLGNMNKVSPSSNNNNGDKIILALINWLSDESNMYDDVHEIIQNMKWENISLSLIFEFLIKFPHLVDDLAVEKNLIEAINRKFKMEVNTINNGKNYLIKNNTHRDNMPYRNKGDLLLNQSDVFDERMDEHSIIRDADEYNKDRTQTLHNYNLNNIGINTNTLQTSSITSIFLKNLIECSKKIHFTKYLFDNLKLEKMNKQVIRERIDNVDKTTNNMRRDTNLPPMPEMELNPVILIDKNSKDSKKSKIKIVEVSQIQENDINKVKSSGSAKDSARKIEKSISNNNPNQTTSLTLTGLLSQSQRNLSLSKSKPNYTNKLIKKENKITTNPTTQRELFYKPPANNRNYFGMDYFTNMSTRRTLSKRDLQSLSFSKEMSQSNFTSQSRNTFKQTFTKRSSNAQNRSKDSVYRERPNSNMH